MAVGEAGENGLVARVGGGVEVEEAPTANAGVAGCLPGLVALRVRLLDVVRVQGEKQMRGAGEPEVVIGESSTYNRVEMRLDVVGLEAAVVLEELPGVPYVLRELLLVYQPPHLHDVHRVSLLAGPAAGDERAASCAECEGDCKAEDIPSVKRAVVVGTTTSRKRKQAVTVRTS